MIFLICAIWVTTLITILNGYSETYSQLKLKMGWEKFDQIALGVSFVFGILPTIGFSLATYFLLKAYY